MIKSISNGFNKSRFPVVDVQHGVDPIGQFGTI